VMYVPKSEIVDAAQNRRNPGLPRRRTGSAAITRQIILVHVPNLSSAVE